MLSILVERQKYDRINGGDIYIQAFSSEKKRMEMHWL